MATHSSVLAWRIPGTGEPGGLPSMGSHRVGHDWSDLAAPAAAVAARENFRTFAECFRSLDLTRSDILCNPFINSCFLSHRWINTAKIVQRIKFMFIFVYYCHNLVTIFISDFNCNLDCLVDNSLEPQ